MKYPLPDIESLVYEEKMLTEEDMRDRFAIMQMSFIMKRKFQKKPTRKLTRLDYTLQNKLLREKLSNIIRNYRC